jgi:hypothetical protein
MDRAVVGFTATLPADERASLAEALSRERQHPPRRSWLGGGPGPEPGPGGPGPEGPPLPHG